MGRERLHASRRIRCAAQGNDSDSSHRINVRSSPIDGHKPELPLLLMVLYFKPPGVQVCHDVARETADFKSRYEAMINIMKDDTGQETDERYKDYIANIESATHFVESHDFGKQKRRTAEPTNVHFERIFLRGVKDKLPVRKEDASIVYTSLLARLLHDSKEDLTDFSIYLYDGADDINVKTNTYEINYRNQKGRFFLQLTPDEKELLDMQIDALTIPKRFKGKTKNGNGAKEQMNHLLGVAEDIRFRFGNLAAHLTLRIKIDDRLDNLMTYFKSNSVFTEDRLYNKINEALTLFPNIEQSAYDYFKEYIADFPLKNEQQEPNGESAVLFCQELIERRSYTNLLKHHLEKGVGLKQKDEMPDFLKDFHLPTLPQPSFSSAIV